jgi:hypothetical protein
MVDHPLHLLDTNVLVALIRAGHSASTSMQRSSRDRLGSSHSSVS